MPAQRPARRELLAWAPAPAAIAWFLAAYARRGVGFDPVRGCAGGVGRAIFEVRGLSAATPAP